MRKYKRIFVMIILSVIAITFTNWEDDFEEGIEIATEEAIETVRALPESSVTTSDFLRAEAAILLDGETHQVLFEKHAEKRLYPASTTKILTALIALEKGDLDERIKVSSEVELKQPNESTAWIFEGQVLSLRQLLAGLMLPSGNDAARTIAIYIAKKETGDSNLTDKEALNYFVKLMNERAQEIGANQSHFVNPHGLHDLEHYSTAYDLGLIAAEAMRNEAFNQLVSQQTYRDEELTYQNRNQLLNQESAYYYHGANGIKTGFTDEAGYCLVSSANRSDKRLIAVVLQSTEEGMWKDSIALLDMGFSTSFAQQ